MNCNACGYEGTPDKIKKCNYCGLLIRPKTEIHEPIELPDYEDKDHKKLVHILHSFGWKIFRINQNSTSNEICICAETEEHRDNMWDSLCSIHAMTGYLISAIEMKTEDGKMKVWFMNKESIITRFKSSIEGKRAL